MSDHTERLIRDTFVNLLRQVTWGPTRDKLEAAARELDKEAAYERGMADNYSTAERLNWKADLYQLAAEVRFPRNGDSLEQMMRSRIKAGMREVFTDYERDEDDYPSHSETAIQSALRKSSEGFSASALNEIGREVAAEIERESEAREAAEARMWADERKDYLVDRIDSHRQRMGRDEIAAIRQEQADRRAERRGGGNAIRM